MDFGELFGEALVVGACGVKVGLRPLSADAQRVASFLQGGDAGVGGGGELVECVPVIGADTGGLFGCGGLGALGAGDGGGLSLACPARIALGLVGACLGFGDLAGGVLPGGADVAVRVLAGLADLFGGAVADAAYLLPGERLPAQRDLAELTGTSTELAGKAMAVLRDRGLVETSIRGTFVAERQS